MGRVIQLRRPRTFTSAEEVLDSIREAIFMDGRTYEAIAAASNVSKSTINNIATGRTRWPRHTTLFPVMQSLGMTMTISVPNKKEK